MLRMKNDQHVREIQNDKNKEEWLHDIFPSDFLNKN